MILKSSKENRKINVTKDRKDINLNENLDYKNLINILHHTK